MENDIATQAAHERVRVARALPTLPLTNDAFHAGRLSWTQVRAVTRVASPDDEATYLECARHASGAQSEKLVRGVRRARALSDDTADPERAAWLMRTRLSYDDDGTLVVTIRMPAARGAVFSAALDEAMADLDRESVRRAESCAQDAAGPPAGAPPAASADTAPETGSVPRATHAEGLFHLCQGHLAGLAEAQPGRARRGRARLCVHIDTLSGWSRLPDGELLPPGTLGASLTCVEEPVRPLTAADLTSRDLGRSRHDPRPALRQLVSTIDGERCRLSCCTRRRRLHAHHVTPWAQGGATDLANLVLLCPRRHTLLHAEGFLLVLLAERRLGISTAAGTAVPHRPGGRCRSSPRRRCSRPWAPRIRAFASRSMPAPFPRRPAATGWTCTTPSRSLSSRRPEQLIRAGKSNLQPQQIGALGQCLPLHPHVPRVLERIVQA